MKVFPLSISGALEIHWDAFADERGTFVRTYSVPDFAAHGIDFVARQSSLSDNPHRLTLRGFHFQAAPHAESKIVTCARGRVFDVICDLRPESPTYRKWEAVTLEAAANRSIYIPKGCAHAFLTLTDNCTLLYHMSHEWVKESARGVRYDDPFLSVVWPERPALISAKDRSFPDFQGS